MSTQAVTPNPNGNPFDDPSLVQTTKGASNGNPFEDPALISATSSQPAHDAAKKAAMTGTWETPSDISTGGEGSNSDQQLMSDASQREATKGGLAIGAAGALAIPALAAGPLVAAGTAGPALVDAAGEPIIQASKTMLQKFGENYPELTKLATKLGFHVGATGSTVAAWELLKHITGQK
ncbi:MAG TPA: hypothetical protein VNO32_26685 [Candidatus Acidoferrum sp.]|nr:hypothetical protein [Candidatus Acidoferrum sp.]